MTKSISEREVSGVAIEDFRHFHSGGRQMVDAQVHFFLTTSDGKPDGPKAVVPVVLEVASHDSLETVYRALISKAQQVLTRLSAADESDLYRMWHEKAEATESDFS